MFLTTLWVLVKVPQFEAQKTGDIFEGPGKSVVFLRFRMGGGHGLPLTSLDLKPEKGKIFFAGSRGFDMNLGIPQKLAVVLQPPTNNNINSLRGSSGW